MDFLVMLENWTWKRWCKVWNFLEDSFGVKVDLVPEEDLRPELHRAFSQKCAMPRSYKLYLTDIQTAVARRGCEKYAPEIRELMPEMNWSEVGRFRDFVVHHYFGLDMNKVWDIVQTDLPELSQQIEKLLE